MRWIAAVAFAAGLAFVVSSAEAHKYTRKMCIAKTDDGKKMSFVCKASESCCWDRVLRRSACVESPRVCL